MGIVTNCVNKLLTVPEYDHIYQIIEHTLKSFNQDFLHNGIEALLSVLEYYKDYDDIQGIHEAYPGIYCHLITKAHNLKDPENSEYLEAIYRLLVTYSSLVLDLARMGLIELLETLFETESTKINMGGLVILNELVFCKNE